MKIWHISDTHTYTNMLSLPADIDMVIHSGDATNYRDPYKNEKEMRDFITWLDKLPVKHKVFVAGNHDTSIENNLVTKYEFENLGIHYLYMNTIEIEGLKLWGSPYCPTFGNWSFMKSRESIGRKVWDFMDTEADIVITHTPPKGILDLSYHGKDLEFCGCNSLLHKIMEVQPLLHCFGHIHNTKSPVFNAGTRTLTGIQTIFSNGTCVTDGKFGRSMTNGNVINL